MRSIYDIFRSHAILDASGRHVGGCDKCTNHDYSGAYESLFPDRNGIKLMMEVGVADGSSLLAWREIFPNAMCVGLDIHLAAQLGKHGGFAQDRIEFYLGDQRSREDCERAARGRQFNFICEDATHRATDTLVCLFNLWPHVKRGGVYVVEEWENTPKGNITALFPQAEFLECPTPPGGGGPETIVALRKV